LPASPCATEFYEIWHTRSTHRRNQIFSQSVQGLRTSDTPKLPFPIDLLRRPYNSVRNGVRHCDHKNYNSSHVTEISVELKLMHCNKARILMKYKTHQANGPYQQDHNLRNANDSLSTVARTAYAS